MRIVSIFLLLLTLSPAIAQRNKMEKKLIKIVDNNNQEAISLLQKTININSGTMNFEGVKSVGEVFINEFQQLGLDAKWIDGADWNRSGHVVATNNGDTDKPKLLLIGHLDTVFEPESSFQDITVVNDSIWKGPGIADMKGGDVIIVYALKALKEAGLLSKMNIEVVLTGDEENSGDPIELSKRDLTNAAKRADIALAFENADGDPKTIVVARRGSAGWTLKVKGNAAHSSQVFTDKVGVGAIYEASRILTSFYEELSTEPNLTFNPGVIVGGTRITFDEKEKTGTAYGKTNVVAQDVLVKGDIRAISPEQLQKAKATMQAIVKKHYPKASAELTFAAGSYPPLPPSEGNNKLLGYYNEVSKDLGFGEVIAVNPRNAGAADVSFTSGLVDMAIDGMGLSGADDHTIEETGDISKLSVQTKRAAILMYRLSYDKVK